MILHEGLQSGMSGERKRGKRGGTLSTDCNTAISILNTILVSFTHVHLVYFTVCNHCVVYSPQKYAFADLIFAKKCQHRYAHNKFLLSRF